MLGCMEVQTGVADLVLAGGAESMSQAEFYAMGMRWGVKGASVTLEDRLARGRDDRHLRECCTLRATTGAESQELPDR